MALQPYPHDPYFRRPNTRYACESFAPEAPDWYDPEDDRTSRHYGTTPESRADAVRRRNLSHLADRYLSEED